MKVLFVSRGKQNIEISPIIFNQGESLRDQGLQVDYFVIRGKGFLGYLQALQPLRKKIKTGNYDVVHAHFSYSGFWVTLAAPFTVPIVVSLMGTIHKNTGKYFAVRFLSKYLWKSVIVKSELMKQQIDIVKAPVIPNGVKMERFVLTENRENLREDLGFLPNQKIVIFVSDPARLAKNYKLCEESVNLLNDESVKLVAVYDKTHEEVAKYMLAADVLMLGSILEGSPNVIKEAMAARCPIVTTNVGDVKYLLNSLDGTYIMNTFTKEEGRDLLLKALAFNSRTKGVERLIQLGLREQDVARKIIQEYK